MLRASNHIALVSCIVFYGQRNALMKGNGYEKSKRKEEVTKQVGFYSFNLVIQHSFQYALNRLDATKYYQSMECWTNFTKWLPKATLVDYFWQCGRCHKTPHSVNMLSR